MNNLVKIFICLVVFSFIGNTSEPPNIILILADNLGYGDIGAFGSEIIRTPNLDRMAENGRKFTQFYSTSGVCTPSRASLMTGCYAQRIGLAWNDHDGAVLRPVSPYGLHPSEITIADILKRAGYYTGIIGKWHLGDQNQFLPLQHGFDYFYGIAYSDDMTKEAGLKRGEDWPELPLMQDNKVIMQGVDRNKLTKNYTEKAINFIQEHRDEPFFLYLPHAMPGSTKEPFSSDKFRGKSKIGPWGDSIEEIDWSVGQVLDLLEELNIDENTLVIFTSDNGAPMDSDFNSLKRGTNWPLYGRGYTTAEGGFRIPTIMIWPGVIPERTICNELVSTMDLLPTFANLANVDPPTDRIIDGYDITSLIIGRNNAKSPYDAFYYYDRNQLQAIRKGPWKLFLPLDTFDVHPHFSNENKHQPLLFNVVEDISSLHDVAPDNPEIVKELIRLAEIARDDLGDENFEGNGKREIGKIDDPKPLMINE